MSPVRMSGRLSRVREGFLRGEVGAGRDGFVVEEGGVLYVRVGVDCHCGVELC